MATTAPPAPPANAADVNHAGIVEQQIERARRTLKLVEIFSALMTMLAAGLGYLLLAVLIDHWVTPLTAWMRWAFLVGFAVGAGAFVWFQLLPLLLRPINPLYAARSIEQSAATLKNSLLNFLFFRQNRAGVHEAVYTTLQQRAALDLTTPNVDTAVDVSKALRVAYALIAVLVLSAAYTILTPKSAFQSITRVVNPFSQTAAPTRVRIDSVEPGDASAYYGDRVRVRVSVSGLGTDESVAIHYTTADRQTVDQTLPMTATEDGLFFEAELPPDDAGLQQDLTYSVHAGDAVSDSYQIATNAAPSIIVDQVVYDFPEYTGFPQRIEARQGDVRAIEGARVTIHAHANREIRSAQIEFDPGEPTARTVSMQVDGREAIGAFELQLNPQGEPVHRNYRLRFLDDSGKRNPFPILHQIHVTRDYPPVVEILQPELRRIETPLDARQRIEVRAVDPDFALSRVRLRMVVGESEVYNGERPIGRRGQVIERFEITPRELNLSVGDTITYRAYAEDNRTDLSGSPRPNEERTDEYTIVVTAPSGKPMEDASAENRSENGDGDRSQQQDGQNGESQTETQSDGAPQGENGEEGENGESGEKPGEQTGEKTGDESPSKQGGEGTEPDTKGADDGTRNSNERQQPKPDGDSNDGAADGESGSGADKKPGENDSGEPNDQAGQPGGADSDQKPDQQGGGQGESGRPGEGDPNAEQGAGGAGGSSEPNADDPNAQPQGQGEGAGARSEQQPQGPAGQQQSSGQQGGSPADGNQDNGSATPGQGNGDLSQARPNDEPLQDGDAIETIKEHIERNRGTSTGESVRSEDQTQDPDSASNTSRGGVGTEPGQQLSPDQQPANDQGNSGDQIGENSPKSPTGGSPNSENAAGSAKGQDDSATGDNTASDEPGQGRQQSQGEDMAPNETPRGQNANLGAGNQSEGQQGESGNPTNAQQRPADNERSESGMPTEGGMGDNGESGAGEKATSPQASPGAEGANQDRGKSQTPDPSGNDQSNDNTPPPPTTTKKQSDSKGGESGDRSGGGKQGGGQSGQQQGNDIAGSQSAGDEGAGAAQQSGQGDTSAAGGDKQPAGSPTGVSGDREGDGSQTRSGDGAELGGGDNAPSPAAGQRNREIEGEQGGVRSGDGGGLAPQQPNTGQRAPIREVADGGAANLDYADQATELALDYLKHNPDDKALMDKLGWSDADRQRFIERWSQLKKSAREGDAGKQRLSSALEGLGLRQGDGSVRRQTAPSDNAGGLQQEGAGPANLPAHLLERFNAYKRGAAKSRN